MIHILFFSRLGLYLLVAALPALHPAVSVPYDRVGLTAWFVLLPVEMLIAFYLAPPRARARTWLLLAAAPPALFVLLLAGLELATLAYVGAAAAAFLLTVLVFRAGGWGQAVAALEPFALAFVAYRLLTYSRASEAIARQASGVTQMLLVLVPCAFLLHGAVLFLAAFRPRRGKDRRGLAELGLFLLVAVPAFLAVSFLLPPDFVNHNIVLNRPDRDLRPRRLPLDDEGRGWPGGNLRSPTGEDLDGQDGRGLRPGEGDGDGRNALEGLPADQWGSAMGDGDGEGGEQKQYAVMVVASPQQPVYAADAYRGDFDAERGFLLSRQEPLNDLAWLRFLETWRDPAPATDALREAVDIFYLSTLPGRYLAYRPATIEPTVLNGEYFPFEYSYRAASAMSLATPEQWAAVPELIPAERAAMEPYLRLPVGSEALATLREQLARSLAGDKTGAQAGGPGRRILAVLRGFSTFQYELGYTEDTSVARIQDFLARTRTGDCTEFSHSAAMLLRLAGVPARVVTGYLASRDLQSPAHWQAVRVLRRAIPSLQEFPPGELYLVTTSQRHSWTQAWLPGFGWVDLESTAFAIPPPPGRNPGDLDVVIPLIEPRLQETPGFRFPWLLALQALAGLAVLAAAGLYLFSGLRQAWLAALSRGSGTRALRALWQLLLVRLSARGYELKKPSLTPAEYAKSQSHEHPELTRFAALYTTLRYRERMPQEERARAWAELRACYAGLLRSTRRPGLGRLLQRAFSLRGLYYL
jgi:transglutaminase-like putative cysteine protease